MLSWLRWIHVNFFICSKRRSFNFSSNQTTKHNDPLTKRVILSKGQRILTTTAKSNGCVRRAVNEFFNLLFRLKNFFTLTMWNWNSLLMNSIMAIVRSVTSGKWKTWWSRVTAASCMQQSTGMNSLMLFTSDQSSGNLGRKILASQPRVRMESNRLQKPPKPSY